jgi:hypothetical protein
MQANKTYYILINTEYYPRGPGWLGAMISWHHTLEAAVKAREKVLREALYPPTTDKPWTDIVSLHFIPAQEDYVGARYVGINGFSYEPKSMLKPASCNE